MRTMFCCVAFGVLTLCQGQLSPLSPTADFLVAGEKAYGMMLPEPICGGTVSQLEWSDDGRYVLALRTDAGSSAKFQHSLDTLTDPQQVQEQSIVIWDMTSRSATRVLRESAEVGQVAEVHWLAGTNSALAVIVERGRTTDPSHPTPMRETLLLLDARSGQAKQLLAADMGEESPGFEISFSPLKPVAVLTSVERRAKPGTSGNTPADRVWMLNCRVVLADGTVSPIRQVEGGRLLMGWTEDGESPIVSRGGVGPDGTWLDQVMVELNPFAVAKLTKGAYVPPEQSTPTVVKGTTRLAGNVPTLLLDAGRGSVARSKANTELHSIWLTARDGGDHSEALVVDDSKLARLSPTFSGVAYVSQGVAMVRPLVTMPKDMFLQALRSAERTKILSNAKQVGLGLIMFASDNDDTLPSSQLDVQKLIEPYMKDPSLYTGFVYTFAGGTLQSVESPAETVIGYMAGPGGKAVVYIDGHVKWQSDQ